MLKKKNLLQIHLGKNQKTCFERGGHWEGGILKVIGQIFYLSHAKQVNQISSLPLPNGDKATLDLRHRPVRSHEAMLN